MNATPVVTATRIQQGYARHTVITDLDVSLGPGVWGLLGPNGAGKTTLLGTLAAVVPAWSGDLEVAGVRVTNETSARAARAYIGYLPQTFSFPPRYTVTDFVTYVAWTKQVPSNKAATLIPTCIHGVGLAEQAGTRLGALSGGMLQRVGIAQALVNDPAFLILDEPTAGLDPRQRLDFRRLIGGLRDKVVLLSTHLVEDVISVCDHVLVMDNGSIMFRGTPADLAALGTRHLGDGSDAERGYLAVLDGEAA